MLDPAVQQAFRVDKFQDVFPAHLSKEHKAQHAQRYKSIPEELYSRKSTKARQYKEVVTLGVAALLLKEWQATAAPSLDLWELASGSGRLSWLAEANFHARLIFRSTTGTVGIWIARSTATS